MKQIPNLFTLLNLFLGCIAVVYAMQSGLAPMFEDNGMPLTNTQGSQYINIPEQIWLASLFIGLAAVVDFLDGFLARAMKASSEMGKQLDSLADVVSFGVAPGIIVYQFLTLAYSQQEDGLNTSMAMLLPAFIIPCAAAYRLARFNLDTEQTHSFKGVPVPAVGLLIASFPLLYWHSSSETVVKILLSQWFWYGVIALVSFLMVSTIPMLSLKFKNFTVKDNIPKLILLVIATVAGFFLGWLAVPVVFIAYVVLSLALNNKLTA
jgi:CDP-diacylglycerol---serine O-phosphatidyltransferase